MKEEDFAFMMSFPWRENGWVVEKIVKRNDVNNRRSFSEFRDLFDNLLITTIHSTLVPVSLSICRLFTTRSSSALWIVKKEQEKPMQIVFACNDTKSSQIIMPVLVSFEKYENSASGKKKCCNYSQEVGKYLWIGCTLCKHGKNDPE